MSISASIPVAQMEAANADLEAQGFGPDNFAVALRAGTGGATHGALHAWDNAPLLAALQAIPGCKVTHTPGAGVSFPDHVAAEALEWADPVDWYKDPVMTGDTRSHDGKTWESLINYNVWEPPVGWREVVTEGYPEWAQPTGAHDAYAVGDRVTHNGETWESTAAANVWVPGVYGWTVVEV